MYLTNFKTRPFYQYKYRFAIANHVFGIQLYS